MQANGRRDRGNGSLTRRPAAGGREKWVGQWRVEGRGVTRVFGLCSTKANPDGLSKSEADKKLREAMASAKPKPKRSDQGHTLHDVGESLKVQMRNDGRREATIEGLDSTLRIHIVPFFGRQDVSKIDAARVHAFTETLALKTTRGGRKLSPKSRRNVLVNLHQLFGYAIQREWRTAENPVKGIRKPVSIHAQGRVHHLEVAEVEALVQAVPDDVLGLAERPMYLTAAMTGLRQGELFALRWRDVDWTLQTIHVQESFVRGEFQSPKSKKVRDVPMSSRVRTELERHYAATQFSGDHDLVFAHPELGTPIDRSKISKRFKAAIKRAGVGGFEPVIDPATGKQKVDASGQPVTRPITRFHDLRHTFATLLASNPQFTMQDVQEYMGHADLKTTLVYAHYRPKQRAAELIDATFQTEAAAPGEDAPGDPVSRLKALGELHAGGVLTDDEFAAAKSALLARL